MTGPDARLSGSQRRASHQLALLVVGLMLFASGWWNDGRRPRHAVAPEGWWAGFDQAHYLMSARSFATGVWAPAGHWYLPAYPLLASPFLGRLADPFLPIDLLCFLASLLLSGGIGRELAPHWRRASEAAMIGFLLSLLWPQALQAWIMPWTSTLAAPLMMGSLLATLRALHQPERLRLAVAAGACGALVASCRPTDAVLLLAVEAVAATVATLPRAGRCRWLPLRWLGAYAAGIALGALPTMILYLAIWGPHLSRYLSDSRVIGFDWRLLPLHWVEIMIDPRPLLPEGPGLIERMPFVGSGIIGLVVLVAGGRPRLALATVAASVLSSVALYLCYRDLHAPGLWQFYNVHYFKWGFGLLMFATMLLPGMLRRRPGLLLLLPPLAALGFCWRMVPVARPLATPLLVSGNRLSVEVPSLGDYDALAIAASGPYDAIYFGPHSLRIDGRPLPLLSDVKAFPISGGVMIQPLRRWPAGRLDASFRPGIALDDGLIRISTEPRPGLPCWFGQASCGLHYLPLAPLPPGRTLSMAEPQGERLLGRGWWYREPGGHWSAAAEATLAFRLPVPVRAGMLTLSVDPLATRSTTPLVATAGIAGHLLARWVLTDMSGRALSVRIPAAAIRADGSVVLTLGIDTPRRPVDIVPGAADARRLGVFLRALRWTPDESPAPH